MYPMIQEATEAVEQVSDGVASNGAIGIFIIIFVICAGLLFWRARATKTSNRR